MPGVAREHLLRVRRLVLWAAAPGSRYQSHALQEWTSSLNALPYFTLPYFTLPYPTLPSVILRHVVATERLLQDSAFGTLCLSAIWTPHHVDFRLLNVLACRIPPTAQQANSPLLKWRCLGVSPEHFDLFSLTKLLVAGRVFGGPTSHFPPPRTFGSNVL